jgi:CCR4-NOT transcriptional complex subunit CAF120
MTGTPLIDLSQTNKKEKRPSPTGLVSYVGQREEQRLLAKQSITTPAMQAEIDRRMRQQQMAMQQQQQYPAAGYNNASILNMPPQNFSPPLVSYSPSPGLQQQQAGYFPSQGQVPVQQGWGAQQPAPSPPIAQYSAGGFVQQHGQPTTPSQPYGASWDQQQAARQTGSGIWRKR